MKTFEVYFAGDLMLSDSGMPICSARARTNGLKVEPACMPLEPPMARFTLVLPRPSSAKLRFTAIAFTWPVPGSTMFMTVAMPDGSPRGTAPSTAA